MKFSELFSVLGIPANKFKVHFAIGQKDPRDPLFVYSGGTFKSWQERQNRRNFEREFILSLVYFRKAEWLFVGIYKPVSSEAQASGGFFYVTEESPLWSDRIGRLVVSFKKEFRQSYPYLESIIDDMEISELLRERYHLDPFPGYQNVLVDLPLLREIFAEEEPTWRTALENVKGVYLINDQSNGRLYVGSASGEEAFWSRWKAYADTGHGGNERLKELLFKEGPDHAMNFRFSILEIASLQDTDDHILSRESHWKRVLGAKEYGYNAN